MCKLTVQYLAYRSAHSLSWRNDFEHLLFYIASWLRDIYIFSCLFLAITGSFLGYKEVILQNNNGPLNSYTSFSESLWLYRSGEPHPNHSQRFVVTVARLLLSTYVRCLSHSQHVECTAHGCTGHGGCSDLDHGSPLGTYQPHLLSTFANSELSLSKTIRKK